MISEKQQAYYQLCPKCNGEGIVTNPLALGASSISTRICPVCNGAKTFYHSSSRESFLKEEVERLKKERDGAISYAATKDAQLDKLNKK